MRAKVAADIAEATAIQRMKDEKTEKEKSKEQQYATIAKAVAVGLVVALSALCWRWTCGKGNRNLINLIPTCPSRVWASKCRCTTRVAIHRQLFPMVQSMVCGESITAQQ